MKDFPFKVYDPTKEAEDLLEQFDPMTAVKGLLNQLGAARQTDKINRRWFETLLEVKEDMTLQDVVNTLTIKHR